MDNNNYNNMDGSMNNGSMNNASMNNEGVNDTNWSEGNMNQGNMTAGTNGNINTDSTGSSAQESGSAYGYSYINQEQKNPNNIWRAEENSSNAGAYTNNANTNYTHGTSSNMEQPYGSSAQTDGGSAYNGTGGQAQTDGNYSNIYGTPDHQSGWNTYTNARKQKKEERARRKAAAGGNAAGNLNFGIKLAKCASIALVFGLVAGTAFEGSSYVAGNLLGTKKEEANINASDNKKEILKTTDSTKSNTSQLTATTAGTGDGVVSIVEECMPSIVAITNMSLVQTQNWFGQVQKYEVPSAGSGIIVGEDDEYLYVATNNHVVSASTTLTLQFCDESTAAAEIKGTDASIDLAVVQVKKADIEPETLSAIKVATFGDSDNIKVGSQAIAIGNALGYGQSVTGGYISATEREVTIQDETTGETFTNDLIQTDAAINPGNSGGALLNKNGEVIGINSSKYSDTKVEGMGFAIPSNMAKPIIEDLITEKAVTEDNAAYLGISGEPVSSTVSAAYNMPEGVFIKEVSSGTAADKYGLKRGDIITKFAGREIKSMKALQSRLAYFEAGEEVEIVIQRQSEGEYKEMTLSVVLGKKES